MLAISIASIGTATTSTIAEEPSQQLAAAYNRVGQRVFSELARKPGNLVISPYSIGVALAMTMSGAGGSTRTELLRTLHFAQASRVEDANAALQAILMDYGKKLPPPDPKKECAGEIEGARQECEEAVSERPPTAPTEIEITNALMITPRGRTSGLISREDAARLHEIYAANAFENATLEAVNHWAAEATKGMIPSLLKQMPTDTVAVILDAIYFKARWGAPFDTAFTKSASFVLVSGETIQTPMMRALQGDFAHVRGSGFRAIRLPYQTPDVGMIIVLPNDRSVLETVQASLDGDALARLFGQLETATAIPVVLNIPRFKVASDAQIKEALRAAGITLAFDPERANFDGMANTHLLPGQVVVSDAIQKAKVEVTEEGTEASAASGEGFLYNSYIIHPEAPFIVDHPFLFYIVDHKTSAILFQGRVADPREGTAGATDR